MLYSSCGLPLCGECVVCTSDFVRITLSYTIRHYIVRYVEGNCSLRLRSFRAFWFWHCLLSLSELELAFLVLTWHFCWCGKLWSPASYSKKNHRLVVLENMVLRISGLKWDEVTGGWIILHNEELFKLHSSPNIIKTKSRRTRWTGREARIW
jgi:hypothetical protein